ncbi:T-cell surface glycoprotein CD3 delta chain [Nothobranchius furzeri]|uniref:T-cell surface glycoprotein CD3 delta chain-like n=1 Tax=Nothobranchius furzeri TaxID=105023 RepID=A0A8C6M6X1_NOTFU
MMEHQLLILLTLAALCSCQSEEKSKRIAVEELADGIKLKCVEGSVTGNDLTGEPDLTLKYDDKNTGEYTCSDKESRIYVKFRTCDNCVELDTASVAGMVVGNLVATIIVGVAVYLIATQSQTHPVPSTKKRSDKQSLIPPEASGSADHYQKLKPKHAQRSEEYDVLRK